MKEQLQVATVTVMISATDENGKPLGGVRETIPVAELLHADYPVLIETCARAASKIEEVINKHYG